ncbi:hypothetical protein OS493_023754 [Desmophyllum pertusum]|uniref:Uncharacterized protein n=1 Tax=Desmophyllum pertusum TaxID=174260 RepID=A0A9W9YLY7_9CNID|nr:hypothetical protein OS493_023754 [Desmophyllum pertusum]
MPPFKLEIVFLSETSASEESKSLQIVGRTPRTLFLRKISDLPVYAVRSERGGRERVLHRNLLLPFNVIPQLQEKQPTAPRDPAVSRGPADPPDPQEQPPAQRDPQESQRPVDAPDPSDSADDDRTEDDVLSDVVILRPEAPEFQPSITPQDMDPHIAEPPTPPPDVPGTAVLLEDEHVPQEPEPRGR